MSASIRWNGLDQLREELRHLPEVLAGEAGSIVQRAAGDAAQDIRADYQAHRRTGNLAEHVKVEAKSIGQFGTALIVKSTAKHASIFEIGSQARHTNIGANRGSMPPGKTVARAGSKHRRSMYQRLKELLVRHGAEVSGDAG